MLGYGNFRGSGSSPRGGFRSGGFRPRRSFGPREMTKIKCAECGKEDEVPFKTRDGSSVLCKECYFKQKGITPRTPGSEESKESSEEVETKVNKEKTEVSTDAENLDEIEEVEDLGEEEKQ
jgi:CxxC-x17-CxxC domain-containing protein